MTEETLTPSNFIRDMIEEDLKNNKNGGRLLTRFPPEPNGYLHVGHAKSININFGLSKRFGGLCNLRMDDTNPTKEDIEYVDSIMEDVKWLGHTWEDRLYYASDYYEQLYQFAVELIKKGLAYVCELTPEQMREYRGTLTEPGKESPFRSGRTVEENLEIFEQMRAGNFPDGSKVLRAKIDMNSPNINMRDPIIYRIKRAHHHRTGDKWCIYPMYDFAHGLSDALEGITHSICTLEFEDHRPLYDWFLDNLTVPCHPQQIEFSRLNLNYTVMSKRKLLELVTGKFVSGWDDPRMPTICGMRRRGYTPSSLKSFCDRIGVSKRDSIIDMTILEDALREDLNDTAPRVMGVLKPLKVVITNFPENRSDDHKVHVEHVEEIDAPYHPQKPELGRRILPLSQEIYIEQDDFTETPPKGYFRLSPGKEVRLRYGYVIKCNEVIKDSSGSVIELRCSYDPLTGGGKTGDGRKVKGIIHWVSANKAIPVEVRLYDRLIQVENASDVPEGKHFTDLINPNSLQILYPCYVEPSLSGTGAEKHFQFERQGYFCSDRYDSKPERLVFNRSVTLRDTWSKIQGQ